MYAIRSYYVLRYRQHLHVAAAVAVDGDPLAALYEVAPQNDPQLGAPVPTIP